MNSACTLRSEGTSMARNSESLSYTASIIRCSWVARTVSLAALSAGSALSPMYLASCYRSTRHDPKASEPAEDRAARVWQAPSKAASRQ